jgi:L-amino acid N-acyltransferase YncA
MASHDRRAQRSTSVIVESGALNGIRPSVEADVEAIAAIYAHHVLNGTGSFETEPPSTEEMHNRRASLVARNLPHLVAIRSGKVVGYSYAGPYRSRAAYGGTVESSVYVRSDVIGRGIGKQLLQALISACEARGFRQMVAVVGDSDNSMSIRLHEQLGFRLVGVLRSVGYKHGRWLDTVLLQLELGLGDRAPPEWR